MPDFSQFKLRPIQSADMDIILEWRNKAHIRAFMLSDNIINPKEHEKWFNQTLAREDADYQILEYLNKPVGLANATGIDEDNHSCHWGFYLGEPDLPRGTGTIMGILMIEHIFNHYKVGTIYGEVFEFNKASLKLHEKLGFNIISDLERTELKNSRWEKLTVLCLEHDKWDKDKISLR